jgi:hypothetical protein
MCYTYGVMARSFLPALTLLCALSPRARADDPMPSDEPAKTAVGVEGRLALRGDSTGLANRYGIGFGLYGLRRWGGLGPLSFWAGVELYYDRFSDTVHVMATGANGMVLAYDDGQELTQTSFVAVQSARAEVGRWGFSGTVGGGISIARFFRPFDGLLPQTDKSDVVPLIRAVAGISYQAWRDTALQLAFTYNWILSDDTVPQGVERTPVKPFGDMMGVGVGALYRF